MEVSNVIFTVIYTIEAALVMMAISPQRYVKNKWVFLMSIQRCLNVKNTMMPLKDVRYDGSSLREDTSETSD